LARKILLADDSVTAQNMGRKILADAGYEVITVNNGSAALKKIAEAKPDLIVLDVYMPGYSGLEVCQRLKEVQETARIPVLLTVGKLEPFKPEESKRVRADGFIVKPFEASELLSALTKLEDKMVPRAESSKPGRFARAIAAVEEGRYDKSAGVDDASSWKERIAFPSKKKKAVEAEDGDDPAIYNAVNKDLRTVVEHKPTPKPQEVRPEEARVDLGALAPEGLPKDVTPEEIAALAAAAAQVKGTAAESKADQPASDQLTPKEEARESIREVSTEAKAETQPENEPQRDGATATFADQKPEDNQEPTVAPGEAAKEGTASPAEVVAAIPGLGSAALTSAMASSNGTGSHSGEQHHAHEHSEEPVTMAVAAGADSAFTQSRWTAVAVAVAADESSTSLEHEMQKAFAAFAAAEMGRLAAVQSTPALEAASAPEISLPVQTAEPASTRAFAPNMAEALNEIASATTDTVSDAVKKFEAVALSYFEPQPVQPVEPVVPTPGSQEFVQPKAEEALATEPHTSHSETPQPDTAQASESARSESATLESPLVESPTIQAAAIETAPERVPETTQEQPKEEPKPAAVESAAPLPEVLAEQAPAAQGFADKISSEQTASEQVSSDQIPSNPASSNLVSAELASAAIPNEPAAEVVREIGSQESGVAETTAAAWASWRRIRDDSKSAASAAPTEQVEEKSVPADRAAMAVAAGAEKAPEEGSASSESESGDIANIVDSVLADLRPKIVAEISKKLGKKK